MIRGKKFWIGLSLLNLCLVALFGLLMRSKMVFPLPFLDYRSILSAHSHLAFSGWVGLVLITLFIYDVLPAEAHRKKSYQRILWALEISSLGMAFSFPFGGYYFLSIVFSTLYILTTYVFGWIFFKDLKRSLLHPVVKGLCIGAVVSLMLSSVGPFGLSYIMITKSTDALFYRDCIYTFLHLQYNGFFTLGVFAHFFSDWIKRTGQLPRTAMKFNVAMLISVIPSLFVALLWHNLVSFYVIGAIGCLFLIVSVIFFAPIFRDSLKQNFFAHKLARVLWIISFASFIIKMILTVGTLYPPLGHAVYGARPVIIGFLHLVFLAFVSFYLLSHLAEEGFYSKNGRFVSFPLYVFSGGVLANEGVLMLQGFEILLKTNSSMYNWLLWVAAIILLVGAILLAAAFYRLGGGQKKAVANATAY